MGRSSALHLAAGALLVVLLGRSALIGFPRSQPHDAPPPASSALVSAAGYNATEPPLGSNSIAYRLYSMLQDDGDGGHNDTCGQAIQASYHCEEPSCEDLVAGYINYIRFQQCAVTSSGLRFLSGLLLIIWMLFLLHVVETTTNDYFVTSLQLAVAILNLSPNVAGVTFLAVGNAACDVIASVAAFATGVPKVGVGTTLGAGIFVTTAVVAAVSFVADVRLARRSFVRDILFFIITIVYLLICTLDGIITVGESFGFIVIYIVFLAVVVGGRCFRMLRTEDDHSSIAGVVHGEGKAISDGSAGSYVGPSGGAGAAPTALPDGFQERKNNILSTLETARREAMQRQHDKEIASLKNAKYFKPDADEEDGDGDLGSGSGDQGFTSHNADEDQLLPSAGPASRSGRAQSGAGAGASITDDLPQKPSKWTAAFQATQGDGADGGGSGGGPQYLPFQMPKYHRKKLAKKLAKRLAARGIHHEVVTADGRTVDIAELALTDPDAAAQMIASAAAAVTAEAMRHDGTLSFQEAAQAAAHGAVVMGHSGGAGGTGADGSSMGPGGVGGGPMVVPVEDLLAVLPQETVKPVARMYLRFKKVFGAIGPYYHAFMHTAEVPMIIARHLTIPLLHDGTYRRRLVLINLPFSLALFTVVMTTHVLKGSATDVGGFPLAALAALIGACAAVPLHLWALPTKGGLAARSEGQGLLAGSQTPSADEPAGAASKAAAPEGGEGTKRHWYSPLVELVLGPKGDPMPKGPAFTVLLLLSFVMSLIWLLLIANELVGTALCFGKILAVPDVVMGLAVLAVGNSINDLAASVTIAREGYPSMAVAGAYAGPMFNVLAGIGLPMLIYTIRAPDAQYQIGKDTPIVWAAFVTLLTSLTVTLIWVPLAGFRITHRIGRFLLAWFFGFILMVIIMGSIPSLAGEDDVVLG